MAKIISPVASFLPVQLNRPSSTKLQKEKKKRGRLAKFPWERGVVNEWGMFAACPNEFGYIALRKTFVPKDIVLIFLHTFINK
jgi:hypothetical protein